MHKAYSEVRDIKASWQMLELEMLNKRGWHLALRKGRELHNNTYPNDSAQILNLGQHFVPTEQELRS